MRRLKILFVVPALVCGGAEIHTIQLVRGLSKWFDVRVIAIILGRFEKDWHDYAARELEKVSVGFTTILQRDLDAESESCKIIRAKLKEANADVILFYGDGPRIPDLFRAAKLNSTIIRIRHTSTYDEFKAVESERDIMDDVICVSPVMASQHNGYFIANSVDTSRLDLDARSFDFKWKHDGVVLGYVGRYDKEKGIERIFASFGKFQRTCNLAIIGVNYQDASLGRCFDEWIKWFKIDRDRVRFADFAFDLSPYYKALDFNLLLSNTEGFPLTVLEAAYFGVPTIMTPVGACVDLFKNRENIFFVENYLEWELGMEKILEKRKEAGLNAQLYVVNHFSEKKMVENYRSAIMKIWEKKSAAA